jgi:uncharacterized protein (TIGR04552 family)
MRPDLLELDSALQPRVAKLRLDLHDAEALRLVLSGGSVIDWHKAAFPDLESVDRLLRLNQLDPDDPEDRRRLRYVYNEAITYVEVFRGLRVPPELRNPADVRDVFRWASDTKGFRRNQMISCMALKLMHVISHMEAADLKLRADVSEYELHDLAHRAVTAKADEMRMSEVPVLAFYGSRKTRASVIQKLLVKRDNLAATIFDKLRYRVVVPTQADLLPAVAWLLRHMVPFHHVLPGQTHNNLVDPSAIEATLPADLAAKLQPLADDPYKVQHAKNEFSGTTYRMVNFVCDLPVRLSDAHLAPEVRLVNGRVVYVVVELQLFDAETAEANERGENSHDRYKARQWERAKARLGRGAFIK